MLMRDRALEQVCAPVLSIDSLVAVQLSSFHSTTLIVSPVSTDRHPAAWTAFYAKLKGSGMSFWAGLYRGRSLLLFK